MYSLKSIFVYVIHIKTIRPTLKFANFFLLSDFSLLAVYSLLPCLQNFLDFYIYIYMRNASLFV